MEEYNKYLELRKKYLKKISNRLKKIISNQEGGGEKNDEIQINNLIESIINDLNKT
tara:strand:- start:288 stop:455 length:168 start_codon:yes stop_codon:yes gene_type:complete